VKLPPIRYTTSPDGTQLGYVVFGEGPDLLVTGHSGFSLENEFGDEMGGAYFAPLGERFRVTYYDPRAAGLSDRNPTTISVQSDADDIMAVAAAAGMSSFALYGSCLLGPGAITAAAQNQPRVRALALWATSADGSVGVRPEVAQALIDQVETHWGMAARNMANMWSPGAEGERLEQLGRAFRKSIEAEPFAERLRVCRFGHDVTDLLQTLDIPVLVMQRQDRMLHDRAAAEIAALASQSQLVRFAGNEHYQWDGDVGEVLDALTDFLGSARVAPRRGATPSGFRTILFTDVVASTPLLAQLKDAKMREVMRDHDAVLQGAVDDHGGRVVKEIGDAFMAEFAVPSAAVECAIAMQRGIHAQFADTDVPIRLRIGINAGEPVEEDGDLHGASVVIAKRLESAAPENGVLVSDVVRQAVAGKDFEFADQGEVALKGFDEPVRAWSVAWS
jgi:class 3 adenylate cyclase